MKHLRDGDVKSVIEAALAVYKEDSPAWRVIKRMQDSIAALPDARGEPFCYLRMLDGKPDWSEDCISSDPIEMDCYAAADGYSFMPLYDDPDPTHWQPLPDAPKEQT